MSKYRVNSKPKGTFHLISAIIGIITTLFVLNINKVLNFIKANEIYLFAIQFSLSSLLFLKSIQFYFLLVTIEKRCK